MSLRRSPLPSILITATLLSLGLNAGAKEKSVSSQAAPEREYRLFVGLDVEVSKDNHFSLIEGYANNRVRTAASPNLVLLRSLDDMRFTYSPKLSRSPLTVTHIQTQKVANTVKAARNAMRNQQALQDYQSDRTSAMRREISEFQANADTMDPDEFHAQLSQMETELNHFSDSISKAADQSMTVENMTSREKILNGDASTTMLVTAKVSAPVSVTDAYLVGIARIRTEERLSQDVIFFDRIAQIDQKPRQIKVIKDGLPKEFKVLDVKIHIYRNGQELVTDKSENQFALTREEALEYLALDRVSKNRGKSLAPEPAWSLAPPELFGSAKADAFDFPMTVEVDETGKVTKIDPTIVVPENVVALVTKLPFFPGLEDGIAVASTTQVNLATFFR